MSSNPEYRVTSLALNLRSQPEVKGANRLAVLPQGQLVEYIEDAATRGWWRVRSKFHEKTLEGFVAKRYLVKAANFPSLPKLSSLEAPLHLVQEGAKSRRASATARAFPLMEANQPTREASKPKEKAQQLTKIVEWLDVEKSPRYEPEVTAIFPHLYAYDYCYLAGVYLPRVWWSRKALSQLNRKEPVRVQYGVTVHEMGANDLHQWLNEFGPGFGWVRTFDLDELQGAANQGQIVLISGQRKDPNQPGQISMVVPETEEHKADRQNRQVLGPLQSFAARPNQQYSTKPWWHEDRYRDFGFWIHS